jgi:hypothetical protein
LLRADFAEMGDGHVNENCDKDVGDYASQMESYLKAKSGPDTGKCFFESATNLKFIDVAMRDEFHRATATVLKWTAEEVKEHEHDFETQFEHVMEPCDYPALPEEYYTTRKTTFEAFTGDKHATQYCVNKYVVDAEFVRQLRTEHSAMKHFHEFLVSSYCANSCIFIISFS